MRLWTFQTGQAVAQHVTPERAIRTFRLENYYDTGDLVAELEAETEADDFAVVIANVDEFPTRHSSR